MTEIVSLTPILGNKSATGLNTDPSLPKIRGGVISIGNFDGVHQGHANLLGIVRQQADRCGGPAIAVVLDPHPATILRPDRVPPKLTSIQQRADRMSRHGIDFLVTCKTTKEFLQLSASTFFQSLVIDRLQCKGVVEGPNFFFGRDRAGDIALLGSMCQDAGLSFNIVEPTLIDHQMISSTLIRQSLERGEIETANHLLNGYHQLVGTVVHGQARGRKIGFPTANLAEIDVVIPAPGVYGGWVPLGDQQHIAAIHIGRRPTFDHSSDEVPQATVEVHLLDYTGNLYDQTLTVDVMTRVRDIARFDSPEALAAQLTTDVQTVRERLASLRCTRP